MNITRKWIIERILHGISLWVFAAFIWPRLTSKEPMGHVHPQYQKKPPW